MTGRPTAARVPARHEAVVAYGNHPDQWVECYEPSDSVSPRGLIMLVHGGYWQAPYTLDLLRPLAADLSLRGWAVANIEYRRDAEGGWPIPEEDVRTAIAAVLASRWGRRQNGPRVSLGHSVGGQLALLTAESVDAVIALAPVTDVSRVWRERLGQQAAQRYFGASPEQQGDVYASASPLQRLPIGRPALVVQSEADDRVPLSHSIAYAAAAKAAGDNLRLEVYPATDHFAIIDPAWKHWPDVLKWLPGALTCARENAGFWSA